MEDADDGRLPPVLESPPKVRAVGHLEDIDRPIKEGCAAWERSLRPGQYFSEKGGRRPMRHRTQAMQGHHPDARGWPRGPDGGAWGAHSPIPSEKDYMPLVPSPTTSPGRRPRSRGQEFFPPDQGNSTDLAEAVAAEVGSEGFDREALAPFVPMSLKDETLPPPVPAPPLEAPWKAPPPGFDTRTLRRQASALRGEAAAAHGDEEAVRRASLRLTEILGETVENDKENVSLAKERLRSLHAALRRLKGERLRQEKAIKAAVAWQETLEELREKLASAEERRRRAERARGDAQRALEAAIDANRTAEEELEPLEAALEAALRRDEVAAEMERQELQEEVADAFLRRPRRSRRSRYIEGGDGAVNGALLTNKGLDSQHGFGGVVVGSAAALSGSASRNTGYDHGYRAGCGDFHGDGGSSPFLHPCCFDEQAHTHTSPLLFPTLSWGFRVFAEACRRSKGMQRLAALRRVRVEAEKSRLLGETFAAWAVGTALERRSCDASRRRATEFVRLCLARWRIFAALEVKFRAERKRRTLGRAMEAWRSSVREARRDRDLDRRLEAMALRRCFRRWRVLRATSTLTPQEYSTACRVADRHRLRRLFEAWHLAALASAASAEAIAQGMGRRRDSRTLAADFRAWASLSRARCWCRHRRLRRGLETLASFAGAERLSFPRKGWWDTPAESLNDIGLRGLPLSSSTVNLWGVGNQRRLPLVGGERMGRVVRTERAQRAAAAASCSQDSLALASAHNRRVGLWRGFRALLPRLAGCAAERGSHRNGQTFFFFLHGHEEKDGDVVGGWAVRSAFRTWCEAARATKRARDGMERTKQRRLSGAVARWRRYALGAARQRRSDRTSLLRTSFIALRQGCAISRRQRSACLSLQNAFVSRRLSLLGSAMSRLAAFGGASTAVGGAMAAAPAARRRREREALEAAWRWWVGGWLRRQAEKLRVHELEAERRLKRERDLAEQLAEAKRDSAAMQDEAATLEIELECMEKLVLDQEEALVSSRRSLAEASAAAAAVKARLGPAARFKTTGKTSKTYSRKRARGAAVTVKSVAKGKRSGCSGGQGTRDNRGGGGVGVMNDVMCDEQALGYRLGRKKRFAHHQGASRIIREAEARRKAAAMEFAALEREAAETRGKMLGQEEAGRAALEGVLEANQRYAEDLERGQERMEEAEREKQRVRADTARLLERAEDLARKAEEEAAQGARGASSAESERVALSLEVSTVEARAREMMTILDERAREAAEMRRALAGKEVEREEERLLRLDHSIPSSPPSSHVQQIPASLRSSKTATGEEVTPALWS